MNNVLHTIYLTRRMKYDSYKNSRFFFYRCVIYGDLLDISPWRNLRRSILGLFQTRATAVPNR